MKDDRDIWVPDDGASMSQYLMDLRNKREKIKSENKLAGKRRRSLTSSERHLVLKKTDQRCHICGGEINGPWDADHVLSHSGGGGHSVENYLPAHRVCNNYRWDYLPEELQEIIRLGVWIRSQIEKQSKIGMLAGDAFVKYEKSRISRRKRQ
jgi:hypothetical protein